MKIMLKGDKGVPYAINIHDLELIQEDPYFGCWLYTTKSTWHKYEKGMGIYIKESLDDLKKLVGSDWSRIEGIAKRSRRFKERYYDDFNEYVAEEEYDEEEGWLRMHEEGRFEE
jgi:hypothetical protein